MTERGERNARRLVERLKELSLEGLHQPIAACEADLRVVRLWRRGRGRARPGPNGTTANTRDYARTKSMRTARIGSCSETAVPEANHRIRSEFLLNVSG